MSDRIRKIINDPVYGFITLDDRLVLDIVSHPWYQRLRRIHQMAFAHLIYPGAMHTRLHHSLGAYHLMCNALSELKHKGIPVSTEEESGAKAAILLHDIGHGPYSHALEQLLVRDVHHEALSLQIMQALNHQFEGRLDTALQIFTNTHPKKFLHQLVSGQLDVDRMDYLSRDSFFTGVSEGVIGYDRILKMLTVHNGDLMVEEKGIYSIEKFLVSRRLMYWQVYLHKTVLSAEMMLVKIIERAKELLDEGKEVTAVTRPLNYFLREEYTGKTTVEWLDMFCQLDDYDVMTTVKHWVHHPDIILSTLCRYLTDRRLLKVKLQSIPFETGYIESIRNNICQKMDISPESCRYLVFQGEAVNTTYDPSDERINVLFKDGSVRDISAVDNALIQQTLSRPMKKFYICYPGE